MQSFFNWIVHIATVLGAVATICGFIVKWLDKKLNDIINPLKTQIHKMDVKECRRFLIDFLIDVENGIGKDQVQWKFAHEVYDHYIKDLNENSYVKDKWEGVVGHEHHE